MRVIFLLVFVIIRAAFCGYTTKIINESKGYSGGFWMGALLTELGILIAVFKKELPDAPPNSYRAVPVVKILKKYHYPFVPPQVEPIDILKGNIYAEGEAAKVNLTFYLIHGLFLLSWYGIILSAYLWYIMGYTIYWMFKYKLFKKGTIVDFVNDEGAAANSNSIKENLSGLKERAGSTAFKLSQKTEGIKTGAAEKTAIAKEKAGAAFAGIKGKAAEFAAEHKKSDDGDATVADVVDETSTAELIEDSTETESFDELYEKAMSSTDDTEEYDEISDEAAYSAESSASNDSIEELVAALAISQASAPATVPNTAPTAAPQQFNYEEKKSPVVYVMAGIIAVLLVGVGILGGMLLMNDKSERNATSVSETQNQDMDENAAYKSTTLSETQNTATTTSMIVATTTVVEKSLVSDENINNASIIAIADLLKPTTNGVPQLIYYGYELVDINNDKIPELIVSYKSITGDNMIHLFIYEDGKYTKIEKYKNGTYDAYLYISDDCSYDPEKGLISYVGYGGGTARYIFQLTNDNRIVLIEELAYYSNKYTHNGEDISESEYNALNAEFDTSYNWKKLDIKPLPDEVQSTAAPKETYKYMGVVTLTSGTLNLRDFPSSESNVITQLTNGTLCGVYALEGYYDWYKIYTDDLSGYVAAQYIQEYKMEEYTNSNKWEKAYQDKLTEFMNSDQFGTIAPNDSMFDLRDINGDNIPELFISVGTYHAATVHAYSFLNGKIIELFDGGEYGLLSYIPSESYLYENVSYAPGPDKSIDSLLKVYKYDEKTITKVIEFGDNIRGMNNYFTIDGTEVDKNKYYNEKEKYNLQSSISLGRNYLFDSVNINNIKSY